MKLHSTARGSAARLPVLTVTHQVAPGTDHSHQNHPRTYSSTTPLPPLDRSPLAYRIYLILSAIRITGILRAASSNRMSPPSLNINIKVATCRLFRPTAYSSSILPDPSPSQYQKPNARLNPILKPLASRRRTNTCTYSPRKAKRKVRLSKI
ncbi:hypothetical protein BDV19DRAFT_231056 [Aspergillus venezuelensis]